jgi:tRNA threonylcarbamoyladenosine biosynthesis protein TsaE
MIHTSTTAAQTQALGEQLGTLLQPGEVVLLTGGLGAGKTQFAKGVARALGVTEEVTSPTFNLVVEYHGAGGAILRHFDLYRLENADELDDIDYFGLLETDGAISLVEWGDKFSEAMPLHYRIVEFTIIDVETRLIQIGGT